MKYLSVYIYRNDSDCTNGGVSANKNRLSFAGPGVEGPFEIEKNEIYLGLVIRNLFGETYLHVDPMINGKKYKPFNDSVGPMFGGNFIYSSDSRFRFVSNYPIPIHDRFETAKQYEKLSR